ncbi:MAG: nucleotide pyrophosphatase/phosphodiesterase family protein [Phycisphaeraceae bacterium]
MIDLPGVTGRLLDQLDREALPSWVAELIEAGRSRIRPVLPAVTMPAQATFSTGKLPQEHGVVANGFAGFRVPSLRENLDMTSYPDYRGNVSFWEQSNKLLQAERVWKTQGRRAAMLFVQSSMGGAADVVVTPKPEHTPDGKTISMCWSDPPELYTKLRDQLGEFPLHHFWGPLAGIKSSEWIVAAARLVWEWHPTDLQWVYVPHMDYDLQKLGPDDPKCVDELAKVLGLITPLAEKIKADGGRLLVLSEYGMTPVSRSLPINVRLREAGLLQPTADGEMDYENSAAFAMVDHQVAHLYCRDAATADAVEKLLQEADAVDTLHRGEARAEIGLNTERAGDIVAFAKPDAWFEYRWWSDFAEAPDFAWTVDIHRKPGYDPTEMFVDREKKRIRADEPHLVKGSHGARSADPANWPILLGAEGAGEQVEATDVAKFF